MNRRRTAPDTGMIESESTLVGRDPAIVEVSNGFAGEPRHVRQPFTREPNIGATSVTYKLGDILARGKAPR